MSTMKSRNVLRLTASCQDGTGTVKGVIMYPEIDDAVVMCKGGASASAIVEYTLDESTSIDQDTDGADTATWLTLDSTLSSVGSSAVVFKMAGLTPVAIRVRQLSSGKTATLTLVGQRRL